MSSSETSTDSTPFSWHTPRQCSPTTGALSASATESGRTGTGLAAARPSCRAAGPSGSPPDPPPPPGTDCNARYEPPPADAGDDHLRRGSVFHDLATEARVALDHDRVVVRMDERPPAGAAQFFEAREGVGRVGRLTGERCAVGTRRRGP